MIGKRLLKEMPETKPYIMKQAAMQWSPLLCNIVFVALLVDVLSHIFYKTIDEQLLLLTTCGVILCTTLRAACIRRASLYSHEASCHVHGQLRMRLFEKLLRMKSGYTKSTPTSELVQLSVEDIDQLEIYFGQYFPQFFHNMFVPVTLFLILVWMDAKSVFVLLLRVSLIPMSIIVAQEFAKKPLSKYQSSYTTLEDSFLENLQDLTTLKTYQADEWKQQEINKEVKNFHKITMKVLTMQLNSVSIMDLIAYGGAALGGIVAVLGFQNGSLSSFQVICIVSLSSEFFILLRLLGSFFHIAMNEIATSDKIFRILNKPQKQTEQKQWKAEIVDIQLRGLSFSYDEQHIIPKHVYMQLKPDQFVVIVGESGSGKSTTARLIAGIIKNYHGRLLIVDAQRRDIDDDTFYQSFLYVSRQPFTFKGSVHENLVIIKDSLDEEVMPEALRKVALLDFATEQGGLDMELREQGNNLSGGQRQRLPIAKALLAQRDVYIFDEVASNIGAESEGAIASVIHELTETKAVIMIMHRLKGTKDCGQICVIGQGTYQEHGRHEELLRLRGIHARMYEKQQELGAMKRAEQHA